MTITARVTLSDIDDISFNRHEVVRLSLLTLGLSATSASLNPSNIPANKFTANTTNTVRGARVTEDDLIHCFDDLHLK